MYTATPSKYMNTYINNITETAIGTGTVITNPFSFLNTTNMTSKIQQTKVAVFCVTRNDDQEIINTEFLKEMWVQTKAGSSIEFEVARDKDLSKYQSSDLVIKTITSVIF